MKLYTFYTQILTQTDFRASPKPEYEPYKKCPRRNMVRIIVIVKLYNVKDSIFVQKYSKFPQIKMFGGKIVFEMNIDDNRGVREMIRYF